MTIIEEVKGKLEQHPIFRERKTRGKYLSILALKKLYGEANLPSGATHEQLAEFADTYASYERAWRHNTKNHLTLRGSDYGDKDELEEFKLNELGYK